MKVLSDECVHTRYSLLEPLSILNTITMSQLDSGTDNSLYQDYLPPTLNISEDDEYDRVTKLLQRDSPRIYISFWLHYWIVKHQNRNMASCSELQNLSPDTDIFKNIWNNAESSGAKNVNVEIPKHLFICYWNAHEWHSSEMN